MRSLLAAAIALGCLASCGNTNGNTKQAVRQAVIDHLSSRKNLDLDMSAMDVDVTSVDFRSNEADAMVVIKPRGSSAGGMQMKYTLEKNGNRWQVKKKAESGSSPHSSGMPGGGPAPGAELPPGHPSMDAPKPAPHTEPKK
ncbi:MAG: hypothetical protein IT168_03625 [Bryobacterales bacterium]|nr:hypothetical protein [Bryobacterales bacterium]